MKKLIIIGKWEAIAILMVLTCTQVFLSLPRIMAEAAGSAAWIMLVYIFVISFIILFIILKLYKKFEGLDIIDLGEKLAGPVGRVITGLLLIIYFISASSIILREFSEDMKVISLAISPISFVTGFFLIGMLIAAFIGLEAIARSAAIVVPIIIVGYLILNFSVLNKGNVTNLAPWLGTGPNKIFLQGLPRISMFSGSIICLILAPYLKSYKNTKFVGYTGLILSAIFILVGVLTYTLVVPYPSSTQYFLPTYQLARMVSFGRFFQRIESIFAFIWVSSALLYLSITFYFTIFFFRKAFKLEYYRPLNFAFASIVFSLSLIAPSLPAIISIESKYFRQYSWAFSFGLALLILLLLKIFNKEKGGIKNIKGERNEAK